MGVRVCYDVHLTALYLWGGKNLRTILAGKVLPKVQGHILFNNWHLCGLCWEDCECKNSHVTTSLDVAATLTRPLKTARG